MTGDGGQRKKEKKKGRMNREKERGTKKQMGYEKDN